MKARVNFFAQYPTAITKIGEVSAMIKESSLDKLLLHLVNIRASQINGCSFCVDMHVKEATIDNERPLRLHHVAVWHESTLFSEKERAALAWTETVTLLTDHVSDEAFAKVKEHFSDKELVELTTAIGMINLWNRLSVSFRNVPGSADKAYGLEKAGL